MKYMVQYKPNREYKEMMNDFDAMLGQIFGGEAQTAKRSPVVDIHETEALYSIEAELPGFSEEDIDVGVEDNILTIKALKEKSEEKDGDERRQYLVKERRGESFQRRFELPKDVDVEQIEGTYKNGLLTLELKKKEEAKPRNIKVKAA